MPYALCHTTSSLMTARRVPVSSLVTNPRLPFRFSKPGPLRSSADAPSTRCAASALRYGSWRHFRRAMPSWTSAQRTRTPSCGFFLKDQMTHRRAFVHIDIFMYIFICMHIYTYSFSRYVRITLVDSSTAHVPVSYLRNQWSRTSGFKRVSGPQDSDLEVFFCMFRVRLRSHAEEVGG